MSRTSRSVIVGLTSARSTRSTSLRACAPDVKSQVVVMRMSSPVGDERLPSLLRVPRSSGLLVVRCKHVRDPRLDGGVSRRIEQIGGGREPFIRDEALEVVGHLLVPFRRNVERNAERAVHPQHREPGVVKNRRGWKWRRRWGLLLGQRPKRLLIKNLVKFRRQRFPTSCGSPLRPGGFGLPRR